jgi:hypothetical protein
VVTHELVEVLFLYSSVAADRLVALYVACLDPIYDGSHRHPAELARLRDGQNTHYYLPIDFTDFTINTIIAAFA